MDSSEVRTKEIRVYLSAEEKKALSLKAAASNQKLSEYTRNCLTRRINKMVLSKEAIAERVVLSKVKQSIMLLNAIASDSTDIKNQDKVLKELLSLTAIVDNAIATSFSCEENDSSNLS